MAMPPLTTALPTIDNLSGEDMARAILQMAVGRRPKDMQFDRNGDGRITSGDALNYLKAFKQQETDRQAQVPQTPTPVGDSILSPVAAPVTQQPTNFVPSPVTNPEFFPTMPTPQEAEAQRLKNLEQQRATGSMDMAYFGPRVDNSAMQQQRETQIASLEQMAASPQTMDLTSPTNNPFISKSLTPNIPAPSPTGAYGQFLTPQPLNLPPQSNQYFNFSSPTPLTSYQGFEQGKTTEKPSPFTQQSIFDSQQNNIFNQTTLNPTFSTSPFNQQNQSTPLSQSIKQGLF